MASLMKVWVITVSVVALFFLGSTDHVLAETHHVVAGGENLDVGSWLSGRVFRVGDKIWFNLENEDKIVELQGPDEFQTCDISNPIKMYTDHVVLDKEGTRYFASANLENCKNGLRIPVSVEPIGPKPSDFEPESEFDPPEHFYPPSEFEPPYGPAVPEPFEPPPQPKPEPKPVYPPPPPPSSKPSAAVGLKGLYSVLFVGLAFCYVWL